MNQKTRKANPVFHRRQFLKMLMVLILGTYLLFFVSVHSSQAADFWSGFVKGFEQSPSGTAYKVATGDISITGALTAAFNWLLYFVFQFVAMLLGIAGILFDWVIKTDNVKFVLDNTAIYESWKMVRDMLNLAFILVLLFSAFCTIFQVDKYHLKNVLLRLVIMALLVNFSFPISRFIIDVSNVAFYFIVNSMLSGQSGSQISSSFAGFSGIVSILKPEQINSSTNTMYLIAAIVFTFILMITLLVIAVMFVIRLVALGILIIFSPVGFVAAIFPSTKHYADDWWGNLFKYSFFAPLMIFMMAIALNILNIMNKTENGKNIITSFLDVAGSNVNNSSTNPNLFGNMAYFAIPIVILWAGLITAQKLSIAGAGVVTNQAKKFAGWAGKKFSGYNMAKRQVDAFSAARKKREEEKAKTRVGGRIGSWINQKQDAAMGIISPKAKKRAEKMRTDENKKDIEEGAKDLVDKGTPVDTLASNVNTHFSASMPKDPKTKKEHAKQAAAYLKQDRDERKQHIKETLQDAGSKTGSYAGSDIEHILNDPTIAAISPAMAAKQAKAAWAADQLAKGTSVNTEEDLRAVSSFLTFQMQRKIKAGANA